jgi:hypothetical protein
MSLAAYAHAVGEVLVPIAPRVLVSCTKPGAS